MIPSFLPPPTATATATAAASLPSPSVPSPTPLLSAPPALPSPTPLLSAQALPSPSSASASAAAVPPPLTTSSSMSVEDAFDSIARTEAHDTHVPAVALASGASGAAGFIPLTLDASAAKMRDSVMPPLSPTSQVKLATFATQHSRHHPTQPHPQPQPQPSNHMAIVVTAPSSAATATANASGVSSPKAAVAVDGASDLLQLPTSIDDDVNNASIRPSLSAKRELSATGGGGGGRVSGIIGLAAVRPAARGGTSFCAQTLVLLKRSWSHVVADRTIFWAMAIEAVFMSVLLGTVTRGPMSVGCGCGCLTRFMVCDLI